MGAGNINGIFSCSDWYPDLQTSGNALFVTAYLKKYGGTRFDIDNGSAEAYAVGQLLQHVAEKTGTIDNATIIKTLHTGSGRRSRATSSWDATARRTEATCSSSGSAASCCPSSRRGRVATSRSTPKPAWGS